MFRTRHDLHATAGRLARLCLAALVPEQCVFCGDGSEQRSLCRRCSDVLPWNTHACCRCALPLPATSVTPLCAACALAPPPFASATVPLRYAFPADTAIKALKFSRQLCYAPVFGKLLAGHLPSSAADALVPVPLHRWRQARRGFNQAGEIARALAKATGLPLLDVVERLRNTPPQSGLPAARRNRNVARAFCCRHALDGQHVVLVDDVVTTGATCVEITRVLQAAGARRVDVLAVARASPGRANRPDGRPAGRPTNRPIGRLTGASPD